MWECVCTYLICLQYSLWMPGGVPDYALLYVFRCMIHCQLKRIILHDANVISIKTHCNQEQLIGYMALGVFSIPVCILTAGGSNPITNIIFTYRWKVPCKIRMSVAMRTRQWIIVICYLRSQWTSSVLIKEKYPCWWCWWWSKVDFKKWRWIVTS